MPRFADIAGEVEICGDDLLSIAIGDTRIAQQLADRLRASGDWLDAVPGLESVVVQFDAARHELAAAADRLSEALDAELSADEEAAGEIEIAVIYGGEDGPDFDAVCEQLGLSAEQLIELHTGGQHQVDMLGFTPGFAFIGGLDPRLDVPRRREPRQQVAPGSVGIAGGRTGLYALAVPGGWSLIGRTEMRLFDVHANPPNRLQPGMRVRFKAVAR